MRNMSDGSDEFQMCQKVGPHQTVAAVKSKAVVKFSAVQVPAKFNRLECNTNLNLPPSNWLTTSSNSCFGLHQALYHPTGFASFRMAHLFTDCVGEVDVVSDAENIKRLLKLPYTAKSTISMIVHKVGNTLLLDEFDIQKNLLRQVDDNWNWLRPFFIENILAYGPKDQNYGLRDKSREALQTKNLLSKFLYYSLKQSYTEEGRVQSQHEMRAPLRTIGPVLPEPKLEDHVPDPKINHVFNRNVVWTFEDIRMLIGTDMPIFGGPNRPCISLRLRDMTQPINVLTGIDYWLDNLMCNVPEVVMCYHLDGIVQKYEIIKTEDLPYLENSQFSPQVVRNVAQNILSFLKANATKAGHTYWLFKGRNDDVVKLYDLSTLCNQPPAATSCDEKNDNPFTVPVAMLLYTVARNMKNAKNHVTPKAAGTIRELLESCIKLLPKEQYPQIVTSSHYILSDLYMPAGVDPKCPKFDFSDADSDSNSIYDEDEDYNETSSEDELNVDDCNGHNNNNINNNNNNSNSNKNNNNINNNKHNNNINNNNNSNNTNNTNKDLQHNVAVQNICDTLKEINIGGDGDNCSKRNAHTPSPLVANTFERCQQALEHVSAGLSCLQFFNSHQENFIRETEERAKTDEQKQRILYEEQNPNMAKPFKAIPLPFERLSDPRPAASNSVAYTEPNEAMFVVAEAEAEAERERKAKKYKAARNKSKNNNENSFTLNQLPLTELTSEHTQKQVAVNFNSQHFGSWNVHLKLLLLEKACLTYATMAENNYMTYKYGDCLRAIYMACRCHQVVIKYMTTMVSRRSCLLGRAGDCFFQMSKGWENIDDYLEQFNKKNDVEQNINNELEKDLKNDDTSHLIVPINNLEHLMVSSCKCYENALDAVSDTSALGDDGANELLRRLGNVRNELGLKYMYWAQEEYAQMIENNSGDNDDSNTDCRKGKETKLKTPKEDPIYIKLAMKSYDSLTRGIDAFNKVQDTANLAFLYCNMGRFMRFRAHLQMPEDSMDIQRKQKMFYYESFAYYEKAKDVLGSRKRNADLWDLVNWELSTATFTLAKQLQDHSKTEITTKSELEKEVLDILQRALKLCDVDHPGTRQILYTYRSGLIHKRIASFHYSQLRSNWTDNTAVPKTTLQLCKHHYERAASILENLKEFNDHLVIQLERISLQEFLFEKASYNAQKIKNMQSVLDICLKSSILFDNAVTTIDMADGAAAQPNKDSKNQVKYEEFYEYALLFENRLQNALKHLIKMLLSGKDPKKLADLYKEMYKETLTGSKLMLGEQKPTPACAAKKLYNLLRCLNYMEQTYKAVEQQ